MSKAIEAGRKREAVRMVVEGGLTRRQASEQSGIGISTLDKALREYQNAAPAESTETEREELTRLRKENHELRQDRDILKKAAAYFAKVHA